MSSMDLFVNDLMDQIIGTARELKRDATTELDQGRLLGYYEVIQRALSQAEAFGIIDALAGGVRDFDPDELLA